MGTSTRVDAGAYQVPTVNFSVDQTSISEIGGVATLTVAVSPGLPFPVTVTPTFGGTAVLGSDYTASATSVTIPAGSTTGTATITLTAQNSTSNSNASPGNTITVTSATATEGAEAIIASPPLSVTITPVNLKVSLALTSTSFSEASGTSTLTATLDPGQTPVDEPIIITIGFTPAATNGAVINTNYTSSGTTLTIPANGTTSSNSITLTGLNPGVYGYNTTATVAIASANIASAGATGSIPFTVLNVDLPPVSLSISNTSFNDAGGTAYVTASIPNGAPTTQPLQVALTFTPATTNSAVLGTNYSVAGATAAASGDPNSNPANFNAGTNTITIPAGVTSDSIVLTGISLGKYGPNFGASLAIASVSPSTAAVVGGTSSESFTVLNTTPPPVSLSLSNTSFNDSGGTATLTASIPTGGAPLTAPVEVYLSFAPSGTNGAVLGTNYSVAASSANPGAWNNSTQVLTIAAGATSASVVLTGLSTGKYGPSLNANVSILQVTGDAVSAGGTPPTFTVVNTEAAPIILTISNATFPDNGGSAVVTVAINYAGNAPAQANIPVVLDFSGIAPNPAVLGTNYTIVGSSTVWNAATQTLTIAAGTMSSSIILNGIPTTTYNPDLQAQVFLANVSGNAVVDPSMLSNPANPTSIIPLPFTITDNLNPPVTLTLANPTFLENGTTNLTVSLPAAALQNVTVTLGFTPATTNGAVLGVDYTVSGASTVFNAATNTVTILAGTSSTTLTISGIPGSFVARTSASPSRRPHPRSPTSRIRRPSARQLFNRPSCRKFPSPMSTSPISRPPRRSSSRSMSRHLSYPRSIITRAMAPPRRASITPRRAAR